MYPVNHNEEYYISGLNLHFANKDKFLYFIENFLGYEEAIQEQNLTGRDKQPGYGKWTWDYSHWYWVDGNLRKYTFFRKVGVSPWTIFDIREFHKELKDTYKDKWYYPELYRKMTNRRPRQHRTWKPIQSRRHHNSPKEKYTLDIEVFEDVPDTAYDHLDINRTNPKHRGIRGYGKTGWVHLGRSWKDQSKKKHQYGNYDRDKRLEAYMELKDYFEEEESAYEEAP